MAPACAQLLMDGRTLQEVPWIRHVHEVKRGAIGRNLDLEVESAPGPAAQIQAAVGCKRGDRDRQTIRGTITASGGMGRCSRYSRAAGIEREVENFG